MRASDEAALRQTIRRLEASNASLQAEVSRLMTALRPKAVPPTPKMRKLLTFITDYQRAHDGISPSYDEMAKGLGLATKSGVHRLVTGLEERGAIQRMPSRARAIVIVDQGQRPSPHAQEAQNAAKETAR